MFWRQRSIVIKRQNVGASLHSIKFPPKLAIWLPSYFGEQEVKNANKQQK